MTIGEVNDKLMKELAEEMQSAVDYHQMAIALKESGCEECVFVMEIAKDEMTHAKWLHDYLHEKAMPIPKEVEDRFRMLESAHKI